MAKQVFTRDTISGQVAWVPAVYLTIFPNLEEVPEGTKPRNKVLHAEADIEGKDTEGKQVRAPKKEPAPAEDDANPANTVN